MLRVINIFQTLTGLRADKFLYACKTIRAKANLIIDASDVTIGNAITLDKS